MRPTRAPTRHERLVNALTLAAIELQGLANRLQCTEGLNVQTRAFAFRVAEAGRTLCLAAVSANGGDHTEDLMLHFGQYLTTSARKRNALNPLDEEGVFNKYGKAEVKDHNAVPVNVRRAMLVHPETGEPVPPAS